MGPLLAATILFLCWALGRAGLRLLITPAHEVVPHRLLLELLCGNVLLSLVGLGLTEASWFTAWRCVAVAGMVALAANLAPLRAGSGAFESTYGRADAVGLALILAVFVWVAPPFDTSLYASDSSTYLATGIHIARRGSFVTHDETIRELAPSERADLFLSYRHGSDSGPYVRIAGGLLLPDRDADVVLPAFHPLLSVWIAIFYGLGGDPALTLAITYFAGFAVWALVAFLWTLGGAGAAAIGGALLALLGPQYWYSRFAMPEIPSQYFLWAALVAGGIGAQRKSRGLLHLAGLAAGTAVLMRIDTLVHLALPLGLWLAGASRGVWPRSPAFLLGLALTTSLAVLHQVVFPTHYGAEIALYAMETLRLAKAHWTLVAAAGVTALIAVAYVWRRSRSIGAAADLVLRITAAAAGAGIAATAFATTTPDVEASLTWLGLFVGWPILALAVPGIWRWLRCAVEDGQRLALALGVMALAQLMYDPRVSPAPLWAIRRFVPIAIPMLTIGAALTIEWLRQRLGWPALIVLGAAIAATSSHSALAYHTPAFEGAIAHARAIGAILPPGAVIIGDPETFSQTQLHIALWGTRDTAAYLLPANASAQIHALRAAFADHPLYWIGPSQDRPLSGDAVRFRLVATYRFSIKTRRMEWYDERDDVGWRDVTLAIYAIDANE